MHNQRCKRPRAQTIHNHVKEDIKTDQKIPTYKHQPKVDRPRHSAPDVPLGSSIPSQRSHKVSRATKSSGVPGRESSSDSDRPMIHRRHNPQPITPPNSHRLSLTPAVPRGREIIDLEDESGSPQYEQPSAVDNLSTAAKEPKLKVESAQASIKVEPLSADMVSRTFLRVRAKGMLDKGAVRVPFSLCKRFESLFELLLSECKVQHELRAKVSDITATFPWDKEDQRWIRKGRLEDWAYFCEDLRKAWEKEPHSFEDGCKIDIMIHVPDKRA